jgi:hypothetical protein
MTTTPEQPTPAPVMNPAHPQWEDFISDLDDFLCEKGAIRKGMTKPFPWEEADFNEATYNQWLNTLIRGCDRDLSLTRTLLSEYGCDIDASLSEVAGLCDCELVNTEYYHHNHHREQVQS